MKALLQTLALLMGALLFSMVVAEIGLRIVFGAPVHFRYPQVRYISEPAIGHWMEPGQRSFNHHHPVSINSEGIRGPEYSRQVPSGTRRILALGDSQTFGNGVMDSDTWPASLERVLAEEPGEVRWQVINGGLSATDTWQHERMLDRLARAYEFDSVVLGFYVNDVTGVYSVEAPETRTNTLLMRAVYVLKRSALLSFVIQSHKRLMGPQSRAKREQSIVSGTLHPGVEKGWKQVEASLAAIHSRAKELGSELLVVVIPRSDLVTLSEPPAAYNQRIVEIASRLDIPIVDVLGPLRSAQAEGGADLFIPWDGHNSGRANGIIAREIASRVLTPKISPPIAEGP